MNFIIRDKFLKENRQLCESFTIKDYLYHFDCEDTYDIFLSYNYKDFELVKAIYKFLEKQGLSVYVDFLDSSFNRKIVDKETAEKLIERMTSCKALLYVHTINSKLSKWCPWEIGLASGLNNFKCLILPVFENDSSEYKRQEYLELYPYLTYNYSKSRCGPYFWVHEGEKESIKIQEWIK